MTTARCPNPCCGQVSHLIDDPLGRIFRCPRCLRKLPAAPAAAADSGWTAILRPSLRPGTGTFGMRSGRVGRQSLSRSGAVALADRSPSSLESGEVLVGGFGLDDDEEHCLEAGGTLEFEASSEVFIGPLSHPG